MILSFFMDYCKNICYIYSTNHKRGTTMKTKLFTKRGYPLLDMASALQKAIRRSNVKLAGYAAQELFASGYSLYVWKRLLTVAAEDCAGFVSKEIWALYESFKLINTGKKDLKGRIFLSKAVIILCLALKSRDADHMNVLMYDHLVDIDENEISEIMKEVNENSDPIEIPDYVYDVHTWKGKRNGLTKKDFIQNEQKCLTPTQPKQFQIFDHLFE
jgi:replication-associated recombination protein RarA